MDTYNRLSGHFFENVNCITSDIDGYIYIGTDVGFSRVHSDSLSIFSSWKNFTFAPTLNESVNSIAIYGEHIAFGTTGRALYFRFDEINWKDSSISINPTPANIIDTGANFQKILIQPNSTSYQIVAVCGLWNDERTNFTIGSSARNIIAYTPGTEKIVIRAGEGEVLPSAVTNIMFFNGKLYATSWGDGLYQINIGATTSVVPYRNGSIHTNSATKITVDKNGKVWFADGYRTATTSIVAATGVSAIDTRNGRWETHKFRRGVQHQLLSNNIFAIGIDSQNRKYFGSWWTSQSPNPYPAVWGNGYSVYDDSDPDNPTWTTFTFADAVNLTISDIIPYGDKMWVIGSDGVRVLNEDFSLLGFIRQPLLSGESSGIGNPNWFSAIASTDQVTVFGRHTFGGFWVWNHPDSPYTGGPHWIYPGINDGRVHEMGVYQSENFSQVWAATARSLILYDIRGNSRNWYQYGTDLKRRIWSSGTWADSQWYFAGETRLWGSDATTPTCLVVDPFGRVWIGTADRGITMFDIYEDRFHIFNESNSPLVSNDILSMAYQGSTGLLWVGTKSGMMTIEIGKSEKTATKLGDIDVFPNPFRPDIHRSVTIQNRNHDSMPIGKNECRIFDMSGQLVRTLSENKYSEFEWDGNNDAGKKCSSGVYFFIIETEKSDSARGKIVLIR
jgi:hypothetical protein